MNPDSPTSVTPPASLEETEATVDQQNTAILGAGVLGSSLLAKTDDTEDNFSRKQVLGSGLVGSSILALTETASANTNAEYLIIKDCNPWTVDPNVDVLNDLGVPTTQITSNQLATHSLSSYKAVVIPSTQSTTFYQRLASYRSKFEDFVSTGGHLFAHIADSGWPCSTIWSETFLPQGVNKVTDYRNSLSIEQPSHPIAADLSASEVDDWGYSTHGYLTNVPDDATTIFASHGDPTYIEYGYGSGTVLATMQTLEWPWYCDCGSKDLLRNELGYDGSATTSRSGKATTLSIFPSTNEDSAHGGDENNSALPDYSGQPPALVDNWFHGDYWLELPESLEKAESTYKQPAEFDDIRFHKYRHKNQVAVSFESRGTEIVDGTISVTTNDEPVYITLENENNPLRLAKDLLFDGETYKKAISRDRHLNWERTEIDGMDAVRVSTIWGTHDPYVDIMLEYIVDYSITHLSLALYGAPGALAGTAAAFISSTPAIYTWIEYFHLADGRELVRVPDASRYPRHAGYLGDEKCSRTNFDRGEEYALNEHSNDRFDDWVAETQTHHVTPYENAHSDYLNHFTDETPVTDGGPHPVMTYGTDSNGEEINASTVKQLLPDDYLSPF